MCAITGILNFDRAPVDRELLLRMRDSMTHRGPDDCGMHIDGPLGLGSRRLSIIDLVTGNQPIHNEDRSIWVVLNGEIYNYRALRDDLQQRGHRFSTNADTEVIVHSYEELGPACLKVLKGMFAFALWDSNEHSLLLARDRMGEKPLHYHTGANAFIFGSEIKSLLQHPSIERQIDPSSLSKYLTYQYVPAPHTIFRGIRKVQPGHFLQITPDRTREIVQRQYWDIPVVPTGSEPAGNQGRTLTDYSGELLEHLRVSVRSQLVSNVPLGVFLSGGIDSTLLAALAAEAQPGLQTFTMAFDEPTFDESRGARLVADRIGSEHHVEVCRPAEMLQLIPEIASFMDEPLADASILPTFLLSKFTANSVKVVLGGDGGDELFAGYPTFQALQIRKLFRKFPALARRAMEAAIGALPISHDYVSLDFKLRQFLRGVDGPVESDFFYWMGAFTDGEKQSLMAMEIRDDVSRADTFEDIRALAGSRFPGEIERCMYLCAKLYLQDGVLVKVDRASMANSLEVRAPYLDPDIVEFASGIPLKYKMSSRQTKIVLRHAAQSLVPAEILHQKKKGFGVPISQWILHELKSCCLDYLDAGKLKREGLFNPVYVQRLLNDHFDGRRNNSKLIWTLLVFQLWKERWLP